MLSKILNLTGVIILAQLGSYSFADTNPLSNNRDYHSPSMFEELTNFENEMDKLNQRITALNVANEGDNQIPQAQIDHNWDNELLKIKIGTSNIITARKIFDNFTKDYPKISFLKLSLSLATSTLDSYIKSKYQVTVPEKSLQESIVINQMINNPPSWRSVLQDLSKSGKFSFDDYTQLMSKIGRIMLQNYNYSRAEDADSNPNFITVEELLYATKSGTPGGVCRDIAWAQAHMFEELGVSAYEVTFLSAYGRHATMIAMNPNNKSDIIKLNYDEVTFDQGNGPGSLRQQTSLPDIGLGYRVFDASGKPVANIPSELKEILHEVTGRPEYVFNPYKYSLGKLQIGIGNQTIGTVYTGVTGHGQKISGIATNSTFQWKNKKWGNLSLETGLAFSLLKDSFESESIEYDLSESTLYARLKTAYESPSYQKGNFSIHAIGSAELHTLLSTGKLVRKNGETYHFDKEGDAFTVLSLGANFEYDDKVSVTIKENIFPFPRDHIGKSNSMPDTFVGETEIEGKAQIDLSSKTSLTTNMIVYISTLGTRVAMKETLAKGGWEYFVGGEMPISGDVPTFLPGSTTKISTGVKTSKRLFKKDIHFLLVYEKNLDSEENIIWGGIEFQR